MANHVAPDYSVIERGGERPYKVEMILPLFDELITPFVTGILIALLHTYEGDMQQGYQVLMQRAQGELPGLLEHMQDVSWRRNGDGTETWLFGVGIRITVTPKR